jgi:SnoaL-like polyketide cyclase
MSWTFRGLSICSLRTVCSTALAVWRARKATGVSNWAMWSSGWASCFPDVHRELHRVNVLGDVVAIEVSIRGTFLGPFETPAGVIQPTGTKLDIPTADFTYVRDGS